jgi:hypothetical protein
MAHPSDVVSIILLAFICIVLAGLVHKLVGENQLLIVPSFACIAVGLWVMYDYILLNRYKAKEACLEKKTIAEAPEVIAAGMQASTEADEEPEEPDEPEVPQPVAEAEGEFDIDIHNGVELSEMWRKMASPGDTKLANRMKYAGMQAQLSQDIRAQFNKYSLQPWVEEELRDHSQREWWDSDFLEKDF